MKYRVSVLVVLAAVLSATVAAAAVGGGKGRAYEFRGELLAASRTSVQLQVEGGTHDALRALLGQSQNQSFTVDSSTEVVGWSGGKPSAGDVSGLRTGDWVTVRIRAPRGASLADLRAKPAAAVADRSHHGRPGSGPLFLYVGTVTGPQPDDRVALHVTSGNWRGLHTMLGQSLDQTFATDDGTVFLLWQGRVPTVIEPSQLKAGDRITVRVRTKRDSTLAQVETTPANHVGDHEPGNPQTES